MAIENCILGLLVLFCSFQTIRSQNTTACAGAPSGVFVRNSQSCQAYYYCLNGEAHPNKCPENYLFEPIRQVCHIPSYVQCSGCSPYGIQHIAHPTDCSSYYLCVSGIRTLQKCRDNLIFDKSIGDCNAASSVQCIRDKTQMCAEYAGYIKIGDPDDCSKYYSCYYGVAYHQDCAPGLFFKPSIASCTFPEEFDFCEGNSEIVLPSNNNTDEAIVLVGSDHIPNVNGSNDPTDSISEGLIDLPIENVGDWSMSLSSESNDEELASNNYADDFLDLHHDSENNGDYNNEGHSFNSNEGPNDNNSEGPSENSNERRSDNSNEVPSNNSNEFPTNYSNEVPSDNGSEALKDNSEDDKSDSYIIGNVSNETQ